MKYKVLCPTLVIFVLVQYIPIGLSITCYECEERMGNQCEKNVRNVLTENCTGSFVCAKYIWKEYNISTIHRRCAPESVCDTEKALQSRNRTLTICTTCNSNLCNSGEIVNVSAVTVITSFLTALYFYLNCF
ncbi:uncharacterized protein LOC130441293 [Diorhabda sublineata]|uniref:uncharacterized protein LOC130441293 n=1 Tax=Diorhabda sublineata TaxID=1163346 RepID=UPI0024E09851|nr:uncharacterized protein LOC130441293 [Diorhabda sublineata]